MGKRRREEPAQGEDYTPTSGPLSEALELHAQQRCEMFFHYLFYMKALLDVIYIRNQARNKRQIVNYLAYIQDHATHQIAKGRRIPASKRVKYSSALFTFDKQSSDLSDITATNTFSTDAAHFCNLGVSPRLATQIDSTSSTEVRLLNELERVAGDTCQLPQRINLGPDKVIDQLHRELARIIFFGNVRDSATIPRTTWANYKKYLDWAKQRMESYVDAERGKGNNALVECATYYLRFYSKQLENPRRNHSNTHWAVFRFISAGQEWFCQNVNLDAKNYVSL